MTLSIRDLRAHEILDSGGRPTIEAEVELADGTTARASVPAGTSTGQHEAHELRDGDRSRYDGQGVLRAVAAVEETIRPALVGLDPLDQAGLDATLIELDGTENRSRLGANAMLAVSSAVARAAAAASHIPMCRHLGGGTLLPTTMVNIISGGLHAEGELQFQDFMVMPLRGSTFREALETVAAVRTATGRLLAERGLSTLKAAEGGFGPALASPASALEILVEAIETRRAHPGVDVSIAIDVAATHFYDGTAYRLQVRPGTSTRMRSSGCSPSLSRRIRSGRSRTAWPRTTGGGWARLTERLASRVQLVGDDLFTTRAERLSRGIESGVANAVLVKMNQIGTVTETIAIVGQARAAGYATVVSARSGETEDDFIADLAVAVSAGQIKIGSLAQSERLAKYNQLLRIERSLGAAGRFAGARPSRRGARRRRGRARGRKKCHRLHPGK
jgi:enolase